MVWFFNNNNIASGARRISANPGLMASAVIAAFA